MPKLSKIRLTGCKYDGLRKEHENSIFDLTKDGNPDHSLFTLQNGGGKGVMMQLIFQLLLPETRWGKNNGNKIISMFYDQRNNLHPFTMHIALEWVLDTIPERRLITGIAIKAIIKNTSNNEDEKTGLSYFLYTYEHENNGYYTIENLPLYDKKTGQAVDIDIFENFIDDNKSYFTKYSQSSVRRKDAEYYSFLESRGIYRSEWTNLKTINKSEGGAGDYFIGASDNKAIFDKIIIPAISENIRNYTYEDGDSLIEMFKSNLSITKDLPVLMKREGDYKDLLVEIKPLIENAESGSRFMDIKDRLINEGNNIYFILKDEESLVIQDIEKWSKEVKRTEEERKDLEFEKDNLYYNKEKRDLKIREEKSIDLDKLFRQKSKEIEESEGELLLYRINNILYLKKEVEGQIDDKDRERKRLVEALDIPDINIRADELNEEIELEWDKTKSNWIDNENQYFGYINYTNQLIRENKDKKKRYETRSDELQNEINIFELRKEAIAKYKRGLEKFYDPMSLAFPERIVEDLIKNKKETDEKIAAIKDEILKYKEKSSNLKGEIERLEYIVNMEEENVNSLKKKVDKQEQYELEIARKVSKQLLEDYDGRLLDHNWFSQKFEALEYMENDKKKNLEDIQRTIWEKNLDKSLNKEDYFIPNKDIVLIKEEIIKIGVHVETGTEYLKQLDEKEKEELLNNYPSFLYSMVIGSQREWELIDKNIRKNLFLNNMVPIYIRSEMKSKNDESFKTIQGETYELIDENKYMAWKNAMEDKLKGLLKTERNIKDDLKNIEEIKQELKLICKTDTALMLNQKLRENEKGILELLEQMRIKEEEKSNIDNKLIEAEGLLEENNNRLEEANILIEQIEEYIRKIEEIKVERMSILKVKQNLKKLKEDIANIEDDNETIAESQNLIRDAYYEWKNKVSNIIEDLKKVYKTAIYEYKVDNSYTNYKTPEFSLSASGLIALIKEKKMLEEDIAAKNSNIAALDTEIKYLNKEFERHIKDLEDVSKDWRQYPYLELPLNEIVIIIREIDKNIKRLIKENNKIKSALDTTQGSIAIMKEKLQDKESQIIKEHRRPPVVLEDEGIDSRIDMLERDIQSNKRYLLLSIDELEKNKTNKGRLEINLTKIKNGYPLDLTKGKMEDILKGKIEDNPDLVVEEWLRKCSNNENQIKNTVDEGERFRANFIKEINLKLEEDKLKKQITIAVKEANISNFKNNIVSFKSMESHFQHELLRLSKDKTKAEEAMKRWTNRASIYVIRMVAALKNMVASMNYTNEQGYAFPLVKLKGVERLPKEESEITYLLDEYFVQTISNILDTNEDINNIEDNVFRNLMGDKVIFSKALQGRYPTLLVYKMSEKNEFKYARARDEYYTTWEAINKGEGDLPEGSGGQTLSVNIFVIMMIMSFKKKHIGNENPSTILILDNPFGKASAKHVLDPIFEIADKLNFQLICFAAPEIIKIEISERFPIFWELKIEDGKIVRGGRIIMDKGTDPCP